MDCLIKTVRSEGYFGMYRGKNAKALFTKIIIIIIKLITKTYKAPFTNPRSLDRKSLK